MINFIICDDNEFFLSEIFNIVNDFCNKLKINYEIYVFKSYDKNFFERDSCFLMLVLFTYSFPHKTSFK